MAMRIYHGGRATGKTEKVVKWLRKNPTGVVLVPDQMQRHYVIDQVMFLRSHVDLLGRTPVRPYRTRQEAEQHVIVFREAVGSRLQGRDRHKVVIDNLEMCLRTVLPPQVEEIEFATHDLASIQVPIEPREEVSDGQPG